MGVKSAFLLKNFQRPLLSDFVADVLDAYDRVITENIGIDSRNILINKREPRVLSGVYTLDNDPHMIEDSIIFIKGG